MARTTTICKSVDVGYIDVDVDIEMSDFSDEELLNELKRRGFDIPGEPVSDLAIPDGIRDVHKYIAAFDEMNGLKRA